MTASLRKVLCSFGGRATVVDVSARDGLQSLPLRLSPGQRATWIRSLLACGVAEVEAGSFVSEGLVPQMSGVSQVLAELADVAEALWFLAPNRRGLEDALKAGAKNVVLLASATERHSVENLGRRVEKVLADLPDAATLAAQAGVRVRLAVSMAWGGPDEVAPENRVVDICRRALDAGIREFTLCDTYGGGAPDAVARLLDGVFALCPEDAVGLHLHDAFGTAMVNAFVGLCAGVRRFDSAIGGLGGCPVLPGGRGNLATGSLDRLLRSLGFDTGIHGELLERATRDCLELLGHKDREEQRCLNPS